MSIQRVANNPRWWVALPIMLVGLFTFGAVSYILDKHFPEASRRYEARFGSMLDPIFKWVNAKQKQSAPSSRASR